MKKILSTLLPTLVTLHVFSQNQDSIQTVNRPVFSGYVDAYYTYDFNNPPDHKRPAFFYSHNRHNEMNVNLAYIKGSYSNSLVRGNLALMAGTYAQYNLAAEQALLQHVLEANAGFKIAKELWLDFGVFGSHIGFESAISKDCWNLTRSILADNSPYYESGAKLTWTPNKKWLLSAMYLNGWQRIQRVPGNNTPAFGTQVTFKPSQKITLNYSTFAGNTKPDSLKQMRYFNNLYSIFQITERFGVIVGFDLGFEQSKPDTNAYSTWYSPVVIVRYNLTPKIIMAARVEHYNDQKGVIIATGTDHGFQVNGYSLNLDYLPAENLVFRIEGRILESLDKIFQKDEGLVKENVFFTTSISFSF